MTRRTLFARVLASLVLPVALRPRLRARSRFRWTRPAWAGFTPEQVAAVTTIYTFDYDVPAASVAWTDDEVTALNARLASLGWPAAGSAI